MLVKQVFQHLRNDQIAAIVRTLAQYPVWIVSEHLPSGEFVPNRDQLAGGSTRLRVHSGVVLTERPFRIRPKVAEVLCDVPEEGHVIRTVAYRF